MSSVYNSVRFNGVNFNVIDGNVTFEGAIELCNEVDLPSTLASFTSIEEFDFIVSFIDELNGETGGPNIYWVGLRRDPEDNKTAENFQFIDGTVNIFNVDNEPPWGEDEPNNKGDDQFCTNIVRRRDSQDFNKLVDQACEPDSDGENDEKTLGGAICRENKVNEAVGLENDALIWSGIGVLAIFAVMLVFFVKDMKRKVLIQKNLKEMGSRMGLSESIH